MEVPYFILFLGNLPPLIYIFGEPCTGSHGHTVFRHWRKWQQSESLSENNSMWGMLTSTQTFPEVNMQLWRDLTTVKVRQVVHKALWNTQCPYKDVLSSSFVYFVYICIICINACGLCIVTLLVVSTPQWNITDMTMINNAQSKPFRHTYPPRRRSHSFTDCHLNAASHIAHTPNKRHMCLSSYFYYVVWFPPSNFLQAPPGVNYQASFP